MNIIVISSEFIATLIKQKLSKVYRKTRDRSTLMEFLLVHM